MTSLRSHNIFIVICARSTEAPSRQVGISRIVYLFCDSWTIYFMNKRLHIGAYRNVWLHAVNQKMQRRGAHQIDIFHKKAHNTVVM